MLAPERPRRARLWDLVADAFTTAGPISRWRDIARPNQLLPDLALAWFIFLFQAGRGAGKTRSAAEGIAELVRRYPGCRVALVAQTFADARDTMVEGESGLLAVLDPSELRGGSVDTAWNRSIGELYFANGSVARIFSSEKPRKLRGPQHHFAWVDEIATFTDAHKDAGTVDTTWSNLMLGLRLPAHEGWPSDYRPRCIVTTTPRRVAILRASPDLVAKEPHRAGITQMPPSRVVIRTGSTDENLGNLAPEFIEAVVDPLRGTRLGRQEIAGELLEDVEGALLRQGDIDAARRLADEVPAMALRAVAVDPATTATDESDLTGIVAVGVDHAGEGYVFDDRSGRYSPEEWSDVVWQLVYDTGADVVVVEDNAGGDMVDTTLKAAWLRLMERERAKGNPTLTRPPVVRVTPSGPAQGKWLRAQPIALLYEQQPGRIHHVTPRPSPGQPARNPLAELEDQATSWTGDRAEKSPDRVDALVHGLSWLLFPGKRRKSQEKPARGVASQRWAAGGRR